jgi:hypothetical protein
MGKNLKLSISISSGISPPDDGNMTPENTTGYGAFGLTSSGAIDSILCQWLRIHVSGGCAFKILGPSSLMTRKIATDAKVKMQTMQRVNHFFMRFVIIPFLHSG